VGIAIAVAPAGYLVGVDHAGLDCRVPLYRWPDDTLHTGQVCRTATFDRIVVAGARDVTLDAALVVNGALTVDITVSFDADGGGLTLGVTGEET
jgi:hypothetical protein